MKKPLLVVTNKTAYQELRSWRKQNKTENLTTCLTWIMQNEELRNYNDELCLDEIIERDIENPQRVAGSIPARPHFIFRKVSRFVDLFIFCDTFNLNASPN